MFSTSVVTFMVRCAIHAIAVTFVCVPQQGHGGRELLPVELIGAGAGIRPAKTVPFRAGVTGVVCAWADSNTIRPSLTILIGERQVSAVDEIGSRASFLVVRVKEGEELQVVLSADRPGLVTLSLEELAIDPNAEACVHKAQNVLETTKPPQAVDSPEPRQLPAGTVLELLRSCEHTVSPDLLVLVDEIGRLSHEAKQWKLAEYAYRALLRFREAHGPPLDLQRERLRLLVAETRFAQGDLVETEALQRSALSSLEQFVEPNHRLVQGARAGLASTLEALKDFKAALELRQNVVQVYEKTCEPNDKNLYDARIDLLGTRFELEVAPQIEAGRVSAQIPYLKELAATVRGHDDALYVTIELQLLDIYIQTKDFPGAIALFDELDRAVDASSASSLNQFLESSSRLAFQLAAEENWPEVDRALTKLRAVCGQNSSVDGRLVDRVNALSAHTLAVLGMTEEAEKVFRLLVAGITGDLVPREYTCNDVQLLCFGVNGYSEHCESGYPGLLPIWRRIVDDMEQCAAIDEHLLFHARLRMVSELVAVADPGARSYAQDLVDRSTKIFGEANDEARDILAAAMMLQGDLESAQSILQDLVRDTESSDYPQRANNLALIILQRGDHTGARGVLEGVLQACKQIDKSDVTLLAVKTNLAEILMRQREVSAARHLLEEVVANTIHSADRGVGLGARMNLLLLECESDAGDKGLAELAELTKGGGAQNANTQNALRAYVALGVAKAKRGDPEGAAKILREAIERYKVSKFPPGHVDVREAHRWCAITEARLGPQNKDAVRESLWQLGRSLRALIESQAASSPREVRNAMTAAERQMDVLHSFVPYVDDEGDLTRDVFEVGETMRWLASAGLRLDMTVSGDSETVRLQEELVVKSMAISEAIQGMGPHGSPTPADASLVINAIFERDRLAGQLRARMMSSGSLPTAIAIQEIASALGESEAVVVYRQYDQWSVPEDPAEAGECEVTTSVMAHVIGHDGNLHILNVGTAGMISKAVGDWHSTLVEWDHPPGEEKQAGHVLRKLVFDEVFKTAGRPKTLYVCADGALHSVPFEALPAPEQAGLNRVLGDDMQIRYLVSLGHFIESPRGRSSAELFVGIGGIDYNAQPTDTLSVSPTPPIHWDSDSEFGPLPDSLKEVETASRLYENKFGDDKVKVWKGAEATKTKLFTLAPRVRYLLIATHGFYSAEHFVKQLNATDPPRVGFTWNAVNTPAVVLAMAPMSLCGLALAGANLGKDPAGRVPGILTAEEIAAFDLRNCELAVLSGCETYLGSRDPGQSINSFQTALAIAGARSSLLARWKVDSKRTSELMVEFYRLLWEKKLAGSVALWEAKRVLRARGIPKRDWAGWILSE